MRGGFSTIRHMPSSTLPESGTGGEFSRVPTDGVNPILLPDPEAPDAAFGQFRAMLAEHGYTVMAVCERTGSPSIYDFRMRAHARGEMIPECGLDVLVALFLDCHTLSVDLVERLLGPGSSVLLMRLRLATEQDGHLTSSVLLYPTEGIYVISDRPAFKDTGIAMYGLATDVVYPAITGSVRTFLSTLPVIPGQRFLELCSGTGVAALIAARGGASHSWAVDITSRSTLFAEFNARLNGMSNVTALRGDLYAPVEGMKFDCVVAHPPYVPSARLEMIYRDGGEDGERVTGAILSRVHEFLAPGGVFHCTCIVSARKGAPAALRVRAMLGSASDEFDMALLGNGATDLATHFVRQLLGSPEERTAELIAQMRLLDRLGVEKVEFCTIVLRRHGAQRKGRTLTADRGGHVRWSEVAWLLDMQALLAAGDDVIDQLLDSRPTLSPLTEFTLTYGVAPDDDERWTAREGEVGVDYPFSTRIPVNAGDAGFLASCSGEKTFAELLHDIKVEGGLPVDLDPRQFMRAISPLVAGGILETDMLPFPRHPVPA